MSPRAAPPPEAAPAAGRRRRPALRTGGWLLGGLLLLAGAVAAWQNLGGDDSLRRVREAGVLRVGYAIEAPYADLDASGRVSGESPETARQIAARAGLPRIEWVQAEFDQLIEGLQSGRFDVVASGLFITPERSRQVLFSEPSLCVRPGWLLRPQAPSGLAAGYAEALRQPGLRMAVLHGSAEAAALAGHPGLVEVPDARAGRLAVLQGTVDALALSLPTVRALAALGPPGQLLARVAASAAPVAGQEPPAGEGCPPEASRVGFAFAPEDRALQARWNQAMAGYLGSPEHLQTLARFGLGADELPYRALRGLAPE